MSNDIMRISGWEIPIRVIWPQGVTRVLNGMKLTVEVIAPALGLSPDREETSPSCPRGYCPECNEVITGKFEDWGNGVNPKHEWVVVCPDHDILLSDVERER